MVTQKTMETFYLACGYGPQDAKTRAGRYMVLQDRFEWARKALEEMSDEDEWKITEKYND